MTGRVAAFLVVLASGLAGCSSTIGLYHSAEGGDIARTRQAPPGADAPYPNLAAVPAAPVALKPAAQAVVKRRLAGHGEGVSAPSPEALAGLSLPAAPPPRPDVPDLIIPQSPAQAAFIPTFPTPAAVAAPARPPSAPVALAFAPGTALLDGQAAVALRGVAAATNGATLLVGGFGEGGAQDAAALALALARARRLADALTADGVPAGAIRLVAMAGGSGGFVQLFY